MNVAGSVQQRLVGKTILVAGAGSIGGGLAKRFAAEGANVVLGDVSLASAQTAATAIAASGGSILAVELDGASEASAQTAVALTCERFGGLDGMHINFASFVDQGFDTGVLELPLADFDETMRVNLRGYYLCTRAALPTLVQRSGSIVYTSSPAATKGEPTRVAYAIAKAGVEALMRHVASRYASAGVRANCISPGSIIAEENEKLLPEDMREFCYSLPLLKSRLGRPEDIAAMSALLMSEDGAYITGQVLGVDGGVILRH